MGEWKQCLLSELGTIVGGATPSTKDIENYENGTISWITPKDLSGYSKRYISNGERNITEKGLKSCSTLLMPKNTVLFTSRAPIGYVAIAGKELCTNQGFKSVVPNDDTDFMFLYYLLKYNKGKIESMGSGTTFKEVSGNTMRNIVVSVPVDKKEQERIGQFLSSIDEKIEQNNEINSNLEQQAQVIFKSWFVDFENFDESIVGSWELQKLGNIACFSQGTQVPIEDQLFVPTEGYTRFIRIIDVTQPSNQDIRYIKDTKKGKVTSSDIFMIRYGTPGIVARNYAGIIANNLFKITPTTEKVTSNYLYHFLKSSDVQNYITQNAVSSTMPAINFSTLKNLEIIIPDDMTMKKFSALSEAIRVKQLELSNENLHLSSIRDTLLPKLMSGEIDLSSIDI